MWTVKYSATKTFFLAAALIAIGCGVAAAFEVAGDQPPRRLLPFETAYSPFVLPADEAADLRDIGFDRVTTLLENEKLVQALNEIEMIGIHVPALKEMPIYDLALAEIYFRMGIDDPAVQFELAKPLFARLMRRHPRWENQPLVAFRLATILERQGLSSDAMAHFGFLIDWYPHDLLADKARLGLLMAGLRAGRLEDTEAQADMILESSRDAEVRYHATLARGVGMQRKGLYEQARDEFDSVINWPEDLALIEDFEMFALAEALLNTEDLVRARQALLSYIGRFPDAPDRADAVLTLADLAAKRQDFAEAGVGYRYLIDQFGISRAGTQARLRLAQSLLTRTDAAEHPEAEQLLLWAHEQNRFFDLQQDAALMLAHYYLRVGKPLAAIKLAGDVFDNPLTVHSATRALSMIAYGFNHIVAGYGGNPALVGAVFDRYRNYLTAPTLPVVTYERLADLLAENLQADTLFDLATASPLAERYPRRSAYFAAIAEYLRQRPDEAAAHLQRLLGLPPPAAKKDEDQERTAADALRLEARLLLARILVEKGAPREALAQLKLAAQFAQDGVSKGRVELTAGLIHLAERAPDAAIEHLEKAVASLGPVGEAQPLREWQLRTRFALGEALYRDSRDTRAAAAFTDLLQQSPDPAQAAMAAIRLDQIAVRGGESLPAEEAAAADDAMFWPTVAVNYHRYLRWLEQNSGRFGDQPNWEMAP